MTEIPIDHIELREALGLETSARIKRLAELIPGVRLSSRKDQRVEQLATAIEDRLDELLGMLDDLHLTMLSHAVHDEWWWYDETRFLAIHGVLPPQPHTMDVFGWNSSTLELQDLFFYNGVLPKDLGERLRPKLKPAAPFELVTSQAFPDPLKRVDPYTGKKGPELPLHLQLGEEVALCEVGTMMRAIQAGELRLSSKTTLPTAASLSKLSAALCAPDWLAEQEPWKDSGAGVEKREMDIGPIRPYAWALTFAMGGFVHSPKTKAELTKTGRALSKKPPAQQLKQLWQKWVGQDRFDELSRVKAIKGQGGRGKHHLTAPSGRRQAIVHILSQVPPGQWINVEMLLRAMMFHDKVPYVADEAPVSLYIGNPSYGNLAYDSTWEVLEGTYTRLFLLEYAATLGLLDVAYASPDHFWGRWQGFWWAEDLPFLSPYDGVSFVRITPLGAWILGINPTYEAPKPPSVELQVLPNLEVVCMGELPHSARLLLDAWCTPSSERTWGLSRDSLLKALDGGGDLDRFVDLLKESAPQDLPQTVTALLKEVRRRAGALSEHGEMVVIEAKSKAIALEIAHHRRTKSMCTLIGEKTLLVPPSRAQAFRKATLGLGYGTESP